MIEIVYCWIDAFNSIYSKQFLLMNHFHYKKYWIQKESYFVEMVKMFSPPFEFPSRKFKWTTLLLSQYVKYLTSMCACCTKYGMVKCAVSNEAHGSVNGIIVWYRMVGIHTIENANTFRWFERYSVFFVWLACMRDACQLILPHLNSPPLTPVPSHAILCWMWFSFSVFAHCWRWVNMFYEMCVCVFHAIASICLKRKRR